MPQNKGNPRNAKPGKTFDDICKTFNNACADISTDSPNPASELLTLIKTSTDESHSQLNESDLTALKVMQLMLPAVNVLTTKSVARSFEMQDAKIEKILSAVRVNRYAIDNQNQYSRRENVRIAGIPEEEQEDQKSLATKVTAICAEMNVQLNKDDFVSCHRVGNKESAKGRPRTVILRTTRDTKTKIFVNKKTLHNKADFKNIYFNEDLTTIRLKLLTFVKKLDNVKSAYTRDGKIICNMTNNKKITVENPDDLFKVGVDEVDYREFGLSDLHVDV